MSGGAPVKLKPRVSFSEARDGADHEAHGYHRRGNEVSVKKVVDTLYSKVHSDPALQPFFAATNMQHLSSMQQKLMSYVFGGKTEQEEAGENVNLRAMHMPLLANGSLTLVHWERFVNHFQETLDGIEEMPAEVRESAMAWMRGTQAAFMPAEPGEVARFKASGGKCPL